MSSKLKRNKTKSQVCQIRETKRCPVWILNYLKSVNSNSFYKSISLTGSSCDQFCVLLQQVLQVLQVLSSVSVGGLRFCACPVGLVDTIHVYLLFSSNDRRLSRRHRLSGLSLLGPMNSTPSIGMSFSLMAFCTQRWYFRKVSVHGSPLRSPFKNFSANQRLKHWSYSRFRSVQASPTLFISAKDATRGKNMEESFLASFGPERIVSMDTASCDWLVRKRRRTSWRHGVSEICKNRGITRVATLCLNPTRILSKHWWIFGPEILIRQCLNLERSITKQPHWF